MNVHTIDGYYGATPTGTLIFIYPTHRGTWYCVKGSTFANFTHEQVCAGVNVELLEDVDHFTWSSPIETEEQFQLAVEY